MKAVIRSAIIICLMISAPSVYAVSPYQSGYNHGLVDGKDSCMHPDGCHWYILQPGKGFAYHSKEFNRGYVDGFCTVSPGSGSDADEKTFICQDVPRQELTGVGKPYWSATPVNVSPDYKQYHMILTHLFYNIGKTDVRLRIYNPPEHPFRVPGDPPWMHEVRAPITDVSKGLKPSEKNATLDAGYFIFPASMAPNSNSSFIHAYIDVLKEDFTAGLNVYPTADGTVYVSIDDYYGSD